MEIFVGFAVFLFGLCVGSFLNVVIYRLGTGRTVGGRSHCVSCGKTLDWFELVPLASFVVQRGKCRSCSAKISWQYPAVELLTAVSFVGVHLKLFHGVFDTVYLLSTIYYLLIISFCILIVVYDIKHTIVPNEFVYPLIALSFFAPFFSGGSAIWNALYPIPYTLYPLSYLLAGPILWAPLAFLWLVSRGRWIGLGDAKIAWAWGWLFGLSGGLSAIVFGFWVGAAVSLLLLGAAKVFQQSGLFKRFPRLTMKTELPFAPFLVVGALLIALFDLNLSALIGF